jgi:hypothetical protein
MRVSGYYNNRPMNQRKKYLIKFLLLVQILINSNTLFCQNDSTITLLSTSEIKQDIDSLIAGYKRYHPTFSDEQFEELYKIKDEINEAISSIELYRKVQPVVAKDLHTTIIFKDKIYPAIKTPLFPFRVIIHNDTLFVKNNLSSNNDVDKGDIILSINGVSSKDVITKLSSLVHAETYRRKIYSLNLNFHSFYRLGFGNQDTFSLNIMRDNKIKKVNVKGTGWNKFRTPNEKWFDYNQIEDEVAYLKIKSFRSTKKTDLSKFMDSAFNFIDSIDAKSLIIDARGGGGLTEYIDTLMGYLTSNPYIFTNKELIKVSSESVEYISGKKKIGKYMNQYFYIEYPPKEPIKQKYVFKGNLYVLIDVSSSSCHTLFPAVIKCNGLGILIGEEAAQPLHSNGGLTRFALPNSNLICFSALTSYKMPCAENNNESVKPDYLVKKTISERLDDVDAILNKALDVIKEKSL